MHRTLRLVLILLLPTIASAAGSGQPSPNDSAGSPTTRPATTQPARGPIVVKEKVEASFDDDAIYDPPVKETERDRVIKLRVPPEIQAQILPQIDPIVRFWHQSPFDMTSYCLMGTKDGVFLSAMGVGSLKYETSGPHVAHPFNYSYTLTCRQLVNRRVPTGRLVTGAIEFTSKKCGHYVIRFEALVHLRPQPDWDAVEPVDAEITWYGPVVEKQ